MRGTNATFTVTVKEICVKEAVESSGATEAETRTRISNDLRRAAEKKRDAAMDEQIKAQLLQTSEADVKKVAESVSWAKFGPKSLAEFKFNLLLEEVAREQNINFENVTSYLRSQARVDDVAAEAQEGVELEFS